MFLILVFALFFAVLAAALFAGTLFFQNIINTQPAEGLTWRAPAAAATLAVFFTAWAFLIVNSDARPGDIPYDAIHRFQAEIDMAPEAAPKLWALKTDGTKVLYVRRINDNLKTEYVDEKKKPYTSSGVVGFEIDNEGNTVKFEQVPVEDSPYRLFQSPEGWRMPEYESGPTGVPTQVRAGRFLANLALNLLHLAFWFVCLWLLLQFRFGEAVLAALVIWLFTTLVILPMLLDRAAAIAAAR